jgi:hypothetical protein
MLYLYFRRSICVSCRTGRNINLPLHFAGKLAMSLFITDNQRHFTSGKATGTVETLTVRRAYPQQIQHLLALRDGDARTNPKTRDLGNQQADEVAATESDSPLLTLPNELISEVASHLESFEDLDSLVLSAPHAFSTPSSTPTSTAAPSLSMTLFARISCDGCSHNIDSRHSRCCWTMASLRTIGKASTHHKTEIHIG